MPTTSEGDGAQASLYGQQRNGALRPSSGYMLPWPVRTLCFCAGFFVAYAQFVSVAFLYLYRYYDIYDYTGLGRDEPEGFIGGNILVISLFHSGGTVAVNDDYPIWFTMSLAAVLTPFGCAGLFVAFCARARWRWGKTLLLASFVIGFVMTLVILHIQMFDGALRMRWMNLFNIDNSYVFFPMHGVAEFVGATLLPGLLYPTLILGLFIWQVVKWIRESARWDIPSR